MLLRVLHIAGLALLVAAIVTRITGLEAGRAGHGWPAALREYGVSPILPTDPLWLAAGWLGLLLLLILTDREIARS